MSLSLQESTLVLLRKFLLRLLLSSSNELLGLSDVWIVVIKLFALRQVQMTSDRVQSPHTVAMAVQKLTPLALYLSALLYFVQEVRVLFGPD